MNGPLLTVELAESLLMWMAIGFAGTMAAVVIVERIILALVARRRRILDGRYLPLVERSLAGDAAALAALRGSPSRHRLELARLLIEPLIDDRDDARIVRTRAIVDELALIPRADRYLCSWWWWRRALALRALGLVQVSGHTAAIVAALDDASKDVRAAALDALADLRNPSSLQAVVVRLHDASLDRGRRAAALHAFGTACEPFLIELSGVDPAHRVNYARALAICGTGRARPVLSGWTRDPRADVRAAAFEALAHVGLNTEAAGLAIEALESADAPVRAMAACALRDWSGPGDAARRLAEHLDDDWPVAVQAARSLQSLGSAGRHELEARASRSDLAGVLARQMLWQEPVRC